MLYSRDTARVLFGEDGRIDWREVFKDLDFKQRRVMTRESFLTYEEFMSESADERADYVRWLLRQ